MKIFWLIFCFMITSFTALAHELSEKVLYIKNSEDRYEFNIHATLVGLSGEKAQIQYFDGGGVQRIISVNLAELARLKGCDKSERVCVGQNVQLPMSIGHEVIGNNGIKYNFERDVVLDGKIVGIYQNNRVAFSYFDGGGVSHMKIVEIRNLIIEQ